jgi:hypothetical protein
MALGDLITAAAAIVRLGGASVNGAGVHIGTLIGPNMRPLQRIFCYARNSGRPRPLPRRVCSRGLTLPDAPVAHGSKSNGAILGSKRGGWRAPLEVVVRTWLKSR